MPRRECFSPVNSRHKPYDGSSHGGRTRRGVRFSLIAPEVQEITHINDFSEEEKAAMWYNRKEYKRIKVFNLKTLDVMEMSGQSIGNESEHICMRGLERRTRDLHPIHLKRRWVLTNEIRVLQEAGEQYDPDVLAELFCAFTAPSALEARKAGLEDEQCVLNYLQEGKQIYSSGTASIYLERLSERGFQAFRDKTFGHMSPRQRRVSTGKLLREETARQFGFGWFEE
jgi:hypothetical protein